MRPSKVLIKSKSLGEERKSHKIGSFFKFQVGAERQERRPGRHGELWDFQEEVERQKGQRQRGPEAVIQLGDLASRSWGGRDKETGRVPKKLEEPSLRN